MPRKDPNNLIKLPPLPVLPQVVRKGRQLAPPFKALPRQPSDRELLEARWRVWQQRSDVKGNGTASILEFQCWEFLVNVKHQQPEVDFYYQYPLLGGRTQFGGYVADFYMPIQRLVWNPAGLHFHWTSSTNRANDILSKFLMGQKGIKLIFLWEDDLTNRPEYTMEKAWQGFQLPGRDV